MDGNRMLRVKKLLSRIAAGIACISTLCFATVSYAYNESNHKQAVSDGLKSSGDIFDNKTMSNLTRELMRPDSDQWYNLPAHCDGGDYLSTQNNGGKPYPISREQANEYFNQCARDMVRYLDAAVKASGKLILPAGSGYVIDTTQLINSKDCANNNEWTWVKGTYVNGVWKMGNYKPSGASQDLRAKCVVLRNFGRILHATTDFYAHTNYADKANPAMPIGITNPPGLDLAPTPAPLLEIYSLWQYRNTFSDPNGAQADQALKEKINSSKDRLPADLASGCWVYGDEEYQSKCFNRIRESEDMQKDSQGDNRSLASPNNFKNAFNTAAADSRRQWELLKKALTEKYGLEKARLMADAISKN
ncbi:hypothetical protein Bsp3421_004235 [Burkholderia sp. FERM BP-3421]|jgi:hypothetical protein|uniref:hypothetical protein n=1 Tax=Burkholderia sp. FERM BP-3421 TaxID=1494466 RepID=UPI00235F2998|nr:hypothetical protein [Burkholderia sp. FERM BP-3421]WDD94125.1 hypothetical protein Bsp3421_004235 [Burkholderia sp. FERM BP-3421]